MTTPTDWRELCAELLEALEIQLDELASTNRLCKRARAALAQPGAEGPTDEELLMTYQHAVSAKVESIIQLTGTYAGMNDLAAATLAGLHAVLAASAEVRPDAKEPLIVTASSLVERVIDECKVSSFGDDKA